MKEATGTDERELPPLPSAFEFLYDFPSPMGCVHGKLTAARWNGSAMSASYQVYTADQMRAYVLADRASLGAAQVPSLSDAQIKEACAGFLLSGFKNIDRYNLAIARAVFAALAQPSQQGTKS